MNLQYDYFYSTVEVSSEQNNVVTYNGKKYTISYMQLQSLLSNKIQVPDKYNIALLLIPKNLVELNDGKVTLIYPDSSIHQLIYDSADVINKNIIDKIYSLISLITNNERDDFLDESEKFYLENNIFKMYSMVIVNNINIPLRFYLGNDPSKIITIDKHDLINS
ncbi:hypothetical protein [Heterosigma akashiwo virus 01]|jgi:hypothetical protein|uniref:Uncharacterized protein n=1 Tax=Heterosigma akashiwo virus 01 TaxID=97195 RepID=A0A1C9C5J7_HAV01|nr:hypothetical protein D1R72_gp229 [Heterosigma akashiwo virus 01]AOM63560.1 hypothetical protein [Heterosigma akashiwo virus 01]